MSFFSHIDHLRRGDRLTFTEPCQTWSYTVADARVVNQGDTLPAVSGSRLVLVTCWPINALFFTTQRYIVTADLTGSSRRGHTRPAPVQTGTPTWTPTLPPSLAAGDLTLQKVSMPMGEMHFAGLSDRAWAQSAQPIQLEKNAIIELNAGIAALEQDRPDWWAVIAPSITMPTASTELGHFLGYASPVQVTESRTGVEPTTVTFDTTLRTPTGRVHKLHAVIAGNHALHITKWDFDH